MVEPGLLRHRITLARPITEQNEYGEQITVFEMFADVWAQKEDLTGRERFLAQQIKAEMPTRFTIRYIDGLNAKMMILADDGDYNILSVADPDGRKEQLVIMGARNG